MTRWTVEDLKRIAKVNQQIRHPLDAPKSPKFGNEKTTWQGMKFDSLRELEKFKQFELERRIRIDFMIVENDGRIRFVDAKGHADEKWLLKRDLIHQNFGILIETV